MEFERLITFLNKLHKNNNRDWFNDNKNEFTELKGQFENFINQLIPKVKQIDGFVDSPAGQLPSKFCTDKSQEIALPNIKICLVSSRGKI